MLNQLTYMLALFGIVVCKALDVDIWLVDKVIRLYNVFCMLDDLVFGLGSSCGSCVCFNCYR